MKTEEELVRDLYIEMRDNFFNNMQVIADPFWDLDTCAELFNHKSSQSFQDASRAFSEALHSAKDLLLRAKAFRAFATCYSEMGLEDKAAEMTRKWQELANDALNP